MWSIHSGIDKPDRKGIEPQGHKERKENTLTWAPEHPLRPLRLCGYLNSVIKSKNNTFNRLIEQESGKAISMAFLSPEQSKMRFRKVTRMDSEEICLDADMIRLLISIDESKKLEQVAGEVGMDSATLNSTLSKLLELNLIEPVQKEVPYLNKRFLDALKTVLSRAVGPMAEFLINDVADDMGLSLEKIPKSQAAELISALSLEIPDGSGKMQFKKAMLELIKKQQG